MTTNGPAVTPANQQRASKPKGCVIYIAHSVRRTAEVYCEDHGHIEVPDAGPPDDWTKNWEDVVAAVDEHLVQT